jgi:hypothetical protein
MNLTTGFGGGGDRGGAVVDDTTHTELTGTTLELTKSTISVVAEDVLASTSTEVEGDGDAEKGNVFDQQVHHVNGDGDVVCIDVLPCPREPPPSES